MATINVDALRAYMQDYLGTAAFNGFPAAMLDLFDVESATGEELCKRAEDLGIDLLPFVVDPNNNGGSAW
ncbi:hypothetical protein [Anaerotardibacter muris]|uniref:hypothetical protein n=1 Tax=Anaerotardibacter muris TaxID=2941505 RepID=UPI00203BF66F|nr:hypothetical protein [Anaerotardibacter muris]